MIQKSDVLQMLTHIQNELDELEKSVNFQLPEFEKELQTQQEKRLWKTENQLNILEGKYSLIKNSVVENRQEKRTTA